MLLEKHYIRIFIIAAFFILAACTTATHAQDDAAALEVAPFWPNSKPWTRWWWHGSAVTREGITVQLKALSAAGFGGVEITPIYGVQNNEENNIAYLSPEWMDMYAHAVSEARRLGMDVDMATGTGWPFGGPQVGPDTAAQKMWSKTVMLSGGQSTDETFRGGALQALVAYGPDAQIVNLTKKVDHAGRLDWTAPPGRWTLYAVLTGGTGQMVKRAAPGGEGLVLDHFSRDALQRYLKRFDAAFEKSGAPWPHAFFNDSFEAYGANWTPDFFKEFKTRRGYELREHLPALFGDADPDTNARVRQDYNQTMGDLLLEEFTIPWTEWAHSHGSLTRNQAHGSPGNLLDLYAAADIPETEIFGASAFPIPGLRTETNYSDAKGRPDPLVMKFASSASHLAGKDITSSETFTWLGEHFNVALSQMKPEADQLAVAGINQFVYHGTAYSPPDAPWPGWLFYASTHFQPTNPIWHDLPALNGDITSAQTLLKSRPYNDILLYWPVHDVWYNHAARGELLDRFSVHNADEWLNQSAAGRAAQWLWDNGYTFDYVSDRLLAGVDYDADALRRGGNAWQVVLVPRCRFMPAATLEQLAELARRGALVLFQDALPEDVPGLGDLDARRARFQEIISNMGESRQCPEALSCYTAGSGEIRVVDIQQHMEHAPVLREPMADYGLTFIRNRGNMQSVARYFIANPGPDHVRDWIPLAPECDAAVMVGGTGNTVIGRAAEKKTSEGTSIFLDIPAGGSLLVFAEHSAPAHDVPALWPYTESAGEPVEVTGTWRVEFIEGGPVLPAAYETEKLASWTKHGPKAEAFSGTARYTIEFELPEMQADAWLLDLGDIRESARVYINDQSAELLMYRPFQLLISNETLHAGRNTLEIEVTSLAANSIRWMDRKTKPWKIFEDANIVDINYMQLNAALWPAVPSGLLGPVTLTPMKYLQPE